MSSGFAATSLSRPLRALAMGLIPLLGASCSDTDPNAFPPVCPVPAILADGADATRFGPGPGRDLTDMVLDGRITGINGRCRRGEEPGTLEVTATVTLELSRGPAATSRTDTVGYFVAVVEGMDIRDKKPLTASVTFPANVDRVEVTSPPVRFSLPTSATKGGGSYAILTSFQLTEDQIAFNRRRGVR